MSADAPAAHAAAPLRERVRWHRSLRTRIAVWSGLITLLFLLLVTLASAAYLRAQILERARLDTRATTLDAAERLEMGLRTITIAGDNLARLVSRSALAPAQLQEAQAAVVESVPGAAGALLTVEPRQPGAAAYARYVGADGRLRDFVLDGYDYRGKPWHRRTQAATRGWWSEPYLNDTAGGVWMASYNVPLQPAGSGMASLDIRLDDLVAPVDSLANLEGWRVMLVAPGGTVALSTTPGVAMVRTLEDYLAHSGRHDLQPAAAAVRTRQPVYFSHRDAHSGEARFTVVEPIGDTGWTLLVAQSYGLIMAEFNRALSLLVAASLVLALLGTLLVRRAARQISRPVEALSRSAAHAISGERDVPLEQQQRQDEVGLLARSLEQARRSILAQMREIEQMGAARQKLESELSIARDIQRAMLPSGRVIDRGREHVEAQALLEPAKAVGGDFYNFIERGASELWFVIGDVSDKGVPAALFMARTVTMLEVAIQTAGTPAEALAETSRRLVQGNDTCMFATVLCGRLDVHSGALWLASAGHDPPLLLPAAGAPRPLPVESGPPLGIDPSDAFPLWHGWLEPGDCLVAYTDGVTEAFNLADEAYGSERLLQALPHGAGAAEACGCVLADVRRFAAGAPPSDDTTVLALSRTRDLDTAVAEGHAVGAKGETSLHISVAQTHEDVARMTDAVDALLARHGASDAAMFDARLIVEEVASNAVAYAVAPGAPLELHARVADGRLWLEFRDRGHAFDPTALQEPDLDADIGLRPVGGLGVHLVRRLAESLDYRREGGWNLLRITLRLHAAQDTESTA